MTQWNIVLPSYTGLTKQAANLLKGELEAYTNPAFPIGIVTTDTMTELPVGKNILLGVGESNPYALHHGTNAAEEYTITVTEGDNQTLSITGADEHGLLWGVVDFLGKYIPQALFSGTTYHPYYLNPLFTDAPMKPYHCTSSPAVARRGLWTWGHTITDYRGYIENMVRCKMNTLVIWNNLPPVNAKDVVDYAHLWGLKILFGYAWGWSTDHGIHAIRHALAHRDDIITEYERDWAPLGCDGIYFQSFTETSEETIDGILIAEAVTDYVNDITGKLLYKYPHLTLQFGLHATSVNQKLSHIARTDPRVEIVWEDCGAFPFSYTPERTGEDDFADTVALAEDISVLRGTNDRFGCVFKGLTCLNWMQFRYPASPYAIGETSVSLRKNRTAEKRPIWRYVQAHWLKNAWYAQTTLRQLCHQKEDCPHGWTALLLAEDGMVEDALWYPVLLCGEMLWNPFTDTQDLLRDTALNPAAVFA